MASPGRPLRGVTVFSVAATPLASRWATASLTLGPGTMWPSTPSNVTRLALRRIGMAIRMTRAVSVLAFQWMRTFWPSVFGGVGGAISSGRPLSKSDASSAVMRAPRLPGRLITVTS